MSIVVAGDKLGRVSDIMAEVLCVIDAEGTVGDARDELAGEGVTGAPVMRGDEVVGVVSQTDLMRADDVQSVLEVMTPTVYAVRPGDPVMLAVRLMADRKIHRVLVVDDAGALQGLVSAMDVLTTLADRFAPGDELGYVELRES